MASKIISIRLNEKIYTDLKNKSDMSNNTVSQYIKNCITTSNIKINNKKDKALLIGAINRIGNNINQIAYSLNIANKTNNLNNVDYETIINQLYVIETSLNNILESD